MMTRLSLSDADLRRFWSRVALPDANGCMLWLAGGFSNGYGQFRVMGAPRGVHRVSLFIAEGEPSEPGMDAAHACRIRRCVAPLHLRWATRSENEADKIRDGVSNRGERHGLSKLTRGEALEIKSRYAAGGISQTALASQYGISQSAVSNIAIGKGWAWATEGDLR